MPRGSGLCRCQHLPTKDSRHRSGTVLVHARGVPRAWILKAREFLNSYRIAWCLMCPVEIFKARDTKKKNPVPCLACPPKNCSMADTFSVIMCPPLACPFVDTRVNVTGPESDAIMTFAAGSPILKTDPFSACPLPVPRVSVTSCRSFDLHGNATSPTGSSISITELYYAWPRVLKAR